jgi:LacI family transcriptional regulator, repressor for deo operon, udp, cdd, tsx, nupC, and nupG
VALTIRDVALAAGVSTATVSRALRGLDNVDANTRARVVRIARELNFSVSPVASRLATGRSGTIGIVTPFVSRWYFTELFAGIEEVLKTYDVDLLLHTTEPRDAVGPAAHVRLRRRVDGALVIGLAPDDAELVGLGALDVPVVLLGCHADGLPSVRIDDQLGARTAVAHLVAGGHERIGLLSGRRLPTRFVPENDRLAGYLQVLEEHGLSTDPDLRQIGQFTFAGGQEAMARLLALDERPTAVFCMSDEMGYGALTAMRAAGVPVGGNRAAGEIAVIGFDGHDLGVAFDLSTVVQPVTMLGRLAAQLLMEHIAGRADAPGTVVPTRLLVRGSTRSATDSPRN